MFQKSSKKNSRIFIMSFHILCLLILCCFLLCVCEVSSQEQNSSSSPSTCLNISSACSPGTYLDVGSGCCVNCSQCNGEKMYVKRQCNSTHNAVCDCERPTYFETKTNSCKVECEYCPTRECKSGVLGDAACLCRNPDCHHPRDKYCENEMCRVALPTTEFTRTPPNPSDFRPTALPGWGIALIATGIIGGIALFVSCFLCVGFITARRSSDPELRGSDSSENNLFPLEGFASTSTKTSFVSDSSSVYPYLSNHSMLQLLKSSNPQLLQSSGDRLSSLQSSPVSARSSPQPVRLIKNITTDKLTAVMTQ